jgi:hypothetical protein
MLARTMFAIVDCAARQGLAGEAPGGAATEPGPAKQRARMMGVRGALKASLTGLTRSQLKRVLANGRKCGCKGAYAG